MEDERERTPDNPERCSNAKDSKARSDMTSVVAARRTNTHFTRSNTSAEHEDHRRMWRSSPTENQLITWKKVCSSPSSFLLMSFAQRRLKKPSLDENSAQANAHRTTWPSIFAHSTWRAVLSAHLYQKNTQDANVHDMVSHVRGPYRLENEVTTMARDRPTTSAPESWNKRSNPCAFVLQTNCTWRSRTYLLTPPHVLWIPTERNM